MMTAALFVLALFALALTVDGNLPAGNIVDGDQGKMRNPHDHARDYSKIRK